MNNKLLYSNVHIHGDHNVVGFRTGIEGQDIQQWIKQYASPVDFSFNFRTTHFASGLGDRIMSDRDFQACLETRSQTFVLIGNAGIGKTTTVRWVLRKLRDARSKDKVLLAAMFYRWSVIKDDPKAHEPCRAMMRLLMDISTQIPDWVRIIQPFYQAHKSHCPAAELTKELITTIIKAAVARNQQPCIFIDGVDECNGEKDLFRTLQLVSEIQEETGVGLMLTDRLWEKSSWRKHFDKHPIRVIVEETASDADIRDHIKARLEHSTVQPLFASNPLFFDEVVRAVKSASSGIFLLVDSNLRHLIDAEGKTESEVRSDLEAITSNKQLLNRSKQSVLLWLERISSENNQGHDSRIARLVLRYVRDARRPLTVPELRHAITWDLEKRKLYGDPREWDNILRACRGLIKVDDSGIVNFYHESLRWTCEDPESVDKLPKAHTELGNICIQYLLQDLFEAADLTNEVRRAKHLQHFALLRYASKHWPQHLQQSPQRDDATPDVEQFHKDTYEFLCSDPKVELSLQIARYDDILLHTWSDTVRSLRRASSADATVFHDLSVSRMTVGLFDPLPDDTEDLEDADPFANCRTTGLHLACRLGLRELAGRLIEGGKAPECKDNQLRTPLHVAASHKHKDLVDDLLKHGVSVDPRDKFGYSPLMAAAECGAKEVVERLLFEQLPNSSEPVANINAQTTSRCSIYKRTALHMAATRGHTKVLNILLSHPKTIVDVRDSRGECALHLAVKTRNVEVFKCFESTGKSIAGCQVKCHSQVLGSCPRCGCSVLHLAALERNASSLIGYILKHYPDLRAAPDANSRIPLHYAAGAGARENVETLIEIDGAAQANARDSRGWPPLIEAINSRNAKIFERLWRLPDFRQDEKLSDRQTYRQYAEKHGSDDILEVLRLHSPAPSRQPTLKRHIPDNIVIETDQWSSRDRSRRGSGLDTLYRSSRVATPTTTPRKASIPWPWRHTPRSQSPSNVSETSRRSTIRNAGGPTSRTYAQATKPSELRAKSGGEDRIDMSPTRRRRTNPKYREFGVGSPASGLKAR